MARRDAVERALAIVAQHPPETWSSLHPPTWIGVCQCHSWLRWGAPGYRGAKCHKTCRREVNLAPFQDVLLAAYLIAGPQAVAVAAEELFYTLPNGQR